MTDMVEVSDKAREMRLAGASEADIRQWISRQLPSPPPYDQPRMKCHACLDRRRVEIWHPHEVGRYKSGKKPREQLTYFCMIDCSCTDAVTRYDPVKHCRVVGTDPLDAKRAELDRWIDDRNRIENHPNYNPDFELFS